VPEDVEVDRLVALMYTKRKLLACEKKLQKRRPILVGHNQFTDLCFLYATFFGPLPVQLDDFRKHIQYLFPRVVDTKYMATRNGHDMRPEETLEDLFESVKDQTIPFVEQPADFWKSNSAHQADYDSKYSSLRPLLFLSMTDEFEQAG